MKTSKYINLLRSLFWDLFCVFSLIGIWPRFIEPKLLFTTKLKCKLPGLPSSLKGLKILQFSDLHFNSLLTQPFLNKLSRKIRRLQPDLILFTGDFLCYGELEEQMRLKQFLKSLNAPFGCFAVLGNHDYATAISVNEKGEYDLVEPGPSVWAKVFARLSKSVVPNGNITDKARKAPYNNALVQLLKETPFTLLHNKTVLISLKEAKLNLCGLGEYMAAKALPSEAFLKYDRRYPGIVLVHNPDGAPLLRNYPGELVLSGHTHGGQINLPWIWKKFTLLENRPFKKGLHLWENKWVYINRGIGSAIPFRFFSPPEILLLTLE